MSSDDVLVLNIESGFVLARLLVLYKFFLVVLYFRYRTKSVNLEEEKMARLVEMLYYRGCLFPVFYHFY
jgi:hypothetical protein